MILVILVIQYYFEIQIDLVLFENLLNLDFHELIENPENLENHTLEYLALHIKDFLDNQNNLDNQKYLDYLDYLEIQIVENLVNLGNPLSEMNLVNLETPPVEYLVNLGNHKILNLEDLEFLVYQKILGCHE